MDIPGVFACSSFDAIVSGNFDELTANLDVTSVGAFQTINGTNVDMAGPGDGFGSLCALPESGNPPGRLQPDRLFSAGSDYLGFDLIGRGRGTTASTAVAFGNHDPTFDLASADNRRGIVFSQQVTLSSSGHLLFAGNTHQIGDVADNVVVSTATGVVPGPTSFLFPGNRTWGIGLGSLAKEESIGILL